MHPVLFSLAQTVGVVLLALAAALLGRKCAATRGWPWICAAALAVVALVAAPRWIPELTVAWPFRAFMQDRLLFGLMAAVAPLLLATLAFRLPRPRERKAVLAFAAAFVVYFCVLPFAGPAVSWRELSRLKPQVDGNRVCRQTTDYTCGPAAATTVLDRLGIAADEGTLGIAAHTNVFFGTGCGDLGRAMEEASGGKWRFRTESFGSARDLIGHAPCVAVVKYNLLIDHFVAVLAVTDDKVEIGDPINGMRTVTHAQFEEGWRKIAVVPDRAKDAVSAAK